MKFAAWRNGKREVSGRWRYVWAADHFVIELDQRDKTTGNTKNLVVHGDTPEWGNWKLLNKEKS